MCVGILVVLLCWPAGLVASQRDVNGALPPTGRAADSPAAKAGAIPWSQIAATAGQQCSGDGLGVGASAGGARLRCGLQRLEGEATSEGLWLTSTVTGQASDRFQVVATAVGRCGLSVERGASERLSVGAATHALRLSDAGTVTIEGQTVRFVRPGLTEEYSVSADGVRQDFVVLEKPAVAGEGRLCLLLAVTGARAERAGQGAQLVLEKSGRKIAYSRLRVSDATGQELPARMEVQRNSECRVQNAEFDLAVVVDDTRAVYPVRIDPTFSDANWISMGGGITGVDSGILNVNSTVHAAVADASGNLYIGGFFNIAGNIFATNIAKWDGTNWSALGSGISGTVSALAVSGSDLYVGGSFTNAGGMLATNAAKWNGSSWSALGSGIGGIYESVSALAVSGSDLYAGGWFTTAGGMPATNIAKWNGSSWSALGSGMDYRVSALAVSGSDLYAGGDFTTAGGSPANSIAKWNGNSWSALGSGVGGSVLALAVSGSDLYAGGWFTTADGSPVNRIAKWNGSSWSALGSGVGFPISGPIPLVIALAVSGSDLYVGATTPCPRRWPGA